MKTPFDIASVLLFALIAVIFLHRSTKSEQDAVPLWVYAVTALACAIGDVLANEGQTAIGLVLLFSAVAGAMWIVWRKPADIGGPR